VIHEDHVRLIENGIERDGGGVWADFGAGSGAFTLALRDIAGSEAEIIAVDRDRGSLRALREAMQRRFPDTLLRLVAADFTDALTLPPLDGIVAANALHYVPEEAQVALLRRWRDYLAPGGRLVIVEYDTDVGNRWVPYPVSFRTFGTVARAAGYSEPVRLGSRPSRFLGSIYAAVASLDTSVDEPSADGDAGERLVADDEQVSRLPRTRQLWTGRAMHWQASPLPSSLPSCRLTDD
jgi:SAM-dependent methyltransferase